jgi:hypothetical protein
LSNPAYQSWKETPHIKVGRYVFLQKGCLPERYAAIERELTDLSGYLPVQYAAGMLGADAHIFNTKQMRLHDRFEYKFVSEIKFVNIRRFFVEHGIRPGSGSTILLDRLDRLYITPQCRFYRIDDHYGVVVYD